MNGDNCIFCPECNKKFPAVKSQNFKKLPRMLIFVLKRFEFDFNTMRKIKVNDYYEFPIELNMDKYTPEYLDNTEIKIKNIFKLKSIVIHQGSCDGGHYYAFIRDGVTQEWHQFNDTRVTDFDIKDIPKEAFGGNTNKNAYLLFYEKEDMNNCENFEKINEIKNLDNVHEEENSDDNDNKDNNDNDEEFNLLKENEIKNNNDENQNENNMNNENKEPVDPEEIKNYLNKKLFYKDYHHLTLELYLNVLNMIDSKTTKDLLSNENNDTKNNYIHPIEKQLDLIYKPNHFCQNLCKYIKKGKIKIYQNENKSKIEFTEEETKQRNIQIFEYIILNYFNVIIHSENRKYLGCYVDLVKFLVDKYEYCANYLLEEFTNYNVIMEYLKNCALYEIKKITVGIIDYAMNSSINYYKKNKGKINNLFGFELVQYEDVSEPKKITEEEDTFENLDIGKELQKNKERNKHPSTIHYLDEMMEDNSINSETSIKKENELIIQNSNISKEVINLIYNIIYVMKKITLDKYIESRFLFAVLLKFAQISDYTQNFLTKDINILIILNILYFRELKNKKDIDAEVFYIGKSYLKDISHQILNPQPGKKIGGEPDKFTNINLRYEFLLLMQLIYGIEDNEIKDQDFSFNNKKYIYELIKSSKTKQDLNYCSNLINKKCLSNKEIFENVLYVLNFIIEQINDSDDAFYDKFDPENNVEIYKNTKNSNFLRRLRSNVHIIFINLFQLKGDNLIDYRQRKIWDALYEKFKEYKKYYALCLEVINIIIDICLRDKKFSQKKLKQLNEIKEWLQKNKIAPKLYEIKGIEMYKVTPINKALYMDLKNISEVNQKLKDEFDREETAKTQKKIDLIDLILQGIEEKTEIEMDLSRYNFYIGEKVIYANKKYEVTEVLDEMIKIKELNGENDNRNLIFKVKEYKEKNKKGKKKEKESLWIEKDNYKLKIIQ